MGCKFNPCGVLKTKWMCVSLDLRLFENELYLIS